MKTTKKIGLMITCLLCFLQVQVYTFGATTDNTDFEVVNGVLVAYHGAGGDVVIPDNLGITEIGDWVFYNNPLTSVSIPEGVTAIGNYTFYACGITSVTIPNSVETIGEGAFANCQNLTSITIPNSVISIGSQVFIGCGNLLAIDVAEGNANYLSENGVLYDTNKTILYAYPAGKNNGSFSIPNSVTEIAQGAFGSCQLTSITIPNSVESIGQGAFSGCPYLTSVNIPNSAETIGEGAFEWCSNLTSITIPKSVVSIGYQAFAYCNSLSIISVDENNSHYSSENGVLYNKNKTILYLYPCGKSDVSFSIPNSVTEIAQGAFTYCNNLISVTISNSVETIGQGTFSNCSQLASITIPNSVVTIEYQAFESCNSLSSILVDESNTHYSFEDGVLYNKNKTILYMYLSYGKSDVSFSIPNSVTKITEGAFAGSKLIFIIIPSSVVSIESSAFASCFNLKNITVNWTTPLVLAAGGDTFMGYDITACTLVVPKGAQAAYKAAPIWQDFGSILEPAPTTGVSLDKTSITMAISAISQLTATVLPANAQNKNIKWSSSKQSVATVSSSGLITAVSGGSAVITATTEEGGFSAACTVVVDPNAQVMKILNFTSFPSGFEEYTDYQGYKLDFCKTPHYEGTVLKDPVQIYIDKECYTESVNVKYSLYTLKKKYVQERKNNLYGTLPESIDMNMIRQADIDEYFDKIYEFPTLTETPSAPYRTFQWDGRTDPQLTGQNESMPVQDFIILAVNNAETGKLMATSNTIVYTYNTTPRFKFIVNTDKDGKQTLSGKIFMMWDDRPVKLTAFLMFADCGLLFLNTYGMHNGGAEATIAGVNSNLDSSGAGMGLDGFFDIAAYTELTNPTVDPENPLIKIYDWPDIKKINWNDQMWKDLLKDAPAGGLPDGGGWPWAPMTALDGDYFNPVYMGYHYDAGVGLFIEALDDKGNPIETYNGVNEGCISLAGIVDSPQLTNPKHITAIPVIKTEGIRIGTDGSGNFKILCNSGVCPESYVLYDVTGQTVKNGNLSGASGETIAASDLRPGVYVITVNEKGGGKYMQKIVVNR